MKHDLYDTVMELIGRGLSDAKIAHQLSVSKTVPYYYRKMNALGKRPVPYKEISAALKKEIWGPHQSEYEIISTRGVRSGGRFLKTEQIERIKEMIKLGLSTRHISKEVECGKNTAKRYVLIYKELGPSCGHGLNIYLCSICGTMRRRYENGKLMFEAGPREGMARNQHS